MNVDRQGLSLESTANFKVKVERENERASEQATHD